MPASNQVLAVNRSQTAVDTDLLTPLGAYLHLRARGSASFLLESVEQGRLGRYSLVGCGSRLLSYEEAETCGEAVVGYLGYDFVSQARADRAAAGRRRAGCRRAASSWPTSSFASTTRSGVAEVLRGEPDEVIALLESRRSHAASRVGPGRRDPPVPVAGRVRARRRSRARSSSGAATPSRSCSRSAPSGATSVSALALYRSLRRVNPSPYLFLLELDGLALVGSSPETLVKCDGLARLAEPDRRLDPAGRGRRRAAARLGEGPRRARHARRPRAQRPVARLRAGHGEGGAVPRGGAVLAHHASRLGGRRRAARRRQPVRPAARVLPGRHRLGRAEGAGDADHLGARGLPPRAVRRRGALLAAGRAARRVHRDPDDRARTTASRISRPGPGSSPTATRRPSTRSACASSPRSRAAIDLAAEAGYRCCC